MVGHVEQIMLQRKQIIAVTLEYMQKASLYY